MEQKSVMVALVFVLAGAEEEEDVKMRWVSVEQQSIRVTEERKEHEQRKPGWMDGRQTG